MNIYYPVSNRFSTKSFERVTRHAPCPICGRPDWCGISEDGAIAVCMRVTDGAIREARNGGAIHRLIERDHRVTPPQSAAQPPTPAAPIERRHAVYVALLDALALSRRHDDDLTRRGLSPEAIERGGYATIPDRAQAERIAAELAAAHDLRHVPGFYRAGGRWQMITMAGYLVPVRDAAGRIAGCKIRRDIGEPRYVWLSSRDRDGGAQAQAATHWARPWRAVETGEAVLTEGPLKGDIIADHLDCAAIAVPGVAAFGPGFGAAIRRTLPELRRIIIAYDADWRGNKAVSRALARATESIQTAGLECWRADWPATAGKGLDDVLAAGEGVSR